MTDLNHVAVYDVIRAKSPALLKAKVNDALNDGWQPLGGMERDKDGFYQAMGAAETRVQRLERERQEEEEREAHEEWRGAFLKSRNEHYEKVNSADYVDPATWTNEPRKGFLTRIKEMCYSRFIQTQSD